MKKAQKILITGVRGLIGSSTISLLQKLGYNVVGLYRDKEKRKEPWECLSIDLFAQPIDKILDPEEISCIVHCAAVLPDQFENSKNIYEYNKIIDRNVLEFSRQYQTGFIFFSSTSVYGFNQKMNYEDDKLIIPDAYSKGKYETELAVLDLPTSHKVVLRVNAPYSPWQERQTVLRKFIEKALAGEDIYYHGTGGRQQDFTHASDIAKAVLQSLKHPAASGIYNISGGNPISMIDLGKMITQHVKDYHGQIVNSGLSDPQEEYKALFSIEKAALELKWYPEISIEKGIITWIETKRID